MNASVLILKRRILSMLCYLVYVQFIMNSKTYLCVYYDRALFPCGDHMVVIIDDREDVWNYAPNLIHVRPYHFFQHTGLLFNLFIVVEKFFFLLILYLNLFQYFFQRYQCSTGISKTRKRWQRRFRFYVVRWESERKS